MKIELKLKFKVKEIAELIGLILGLAYIFL